MAHHKSAIKRIKTNEKARLRNRHKISTLRTELKKFFALLDTGTAEEIQTAFPKISKLYDKAASKGILHKKNASRHISRLAKTVNKILAEIAAE